MEALPPVFINGRSLPPVFYFTMSAIGQLDQTVDENEASTRTYQLIQIHPDNPVLFEHDQEAPYRYNGLEFLRGKS